MLCVPRWRGLMCKGDVYLRGVFLDEQRIFGGRFEHEWLGFRACPVAKQLVGVFAEGGPIHLSGDGDDDAVWGEAFLCVFADALG